jgi:cytochrome c-type biogenesis protein CcmF
VLVGTLYPLVLEVLTSDKISVGAPFFNLTFAPLFVPLLVAVPFGPQLGWKRGDLLGAAQRLIAAGVLGLLAIAVVMAWTWGGPALAPLAVGLAVFVVAGAITDLAERTGLFRLPLRLSARRAVGLPRSTWGTAFAHAGLGLTLLGIVCETTWNSEKILTMSPGDSVLVGGYQATLTDFSQRQGSNYRDVIANFKIRLHGDEIGGMAPSKRTFFTRDTATTEAALMNRGVSQLYISLGDRNSDGSATVRLYHKPFVLLIWFGAVAMAFGGALSLSDRRLRVGAPQPAKAARSLQAAE